MGSAETEGVAVLRVGGGHFGCGGVGGCPWKLRVVCGRFGWWLILY